MTNLDLLANREPGKLGLKHRSSKAEAVTIYHKAVYWGIWRSLTSQGLGLINQGLTTALTRFMSLDFDFKLTMGYVVRMRYLDPYGVVKYSIDLQSARLGHHIISWLKQMPQVLVLNDRRSTVFDLLS